MALREPQEPVHTSDNKGTEHRPIKLEVRDLETGELIARHQIDVPHPAGWMPTWESNDAILIVVQGPADLPSYLLRCPITRKQSCERVAAPGNEPVTAVAAQRHY